MAFTEHDPGTSFPGVIGRTPDESEPASPRPFAFNPGAQTCGAAPGSAVTTAHPAPFRFTGTLHKVTLDLSGELIQHKESQLRVARARQ